MKFTVHGSVTSGDEWRGCTIPAPSPGLFFLRNYVARDVQEYHPMFDFGIIKVRFIRPGSMPGNVWSWSLLLRGQKGIWHITRKSGNLKQWGAML